MIFKYYQPILSAIKMLGHVWTTPYYTILRRQGGILPNSFWFLPGAALTAKGSQENTPSGMASYIFQIAIATILFDLT